MENRDSKNNFSHPAVIVTVLILVFVGGYFLLNKTSKSPQQKEIDTLKTEIESLKSSKTETTQKPNTNPPAVKTKTLTKIIQEWRKSTAYVECYWENSYTHEISLKQSGSGLLVMLNTDPTVITNRHVVSSPQYGTPDECGVGFPDDEYFYYSIIPRDIPAYTKFNIPFDAQPAHGKIQFTANGGDVAYLSGFKMGTGFKMDGSVPGEGELPQLSLHERVRDGQVACVSDSGIGDPLVILGYPSYGSGAGTFASLFSKLEITATEGIVSGQDAGYYTTSAKIEHGNSGGLAIDTNNNCYLGIPTAAVAGEIESLGRILPSSYILK